MHVILVLGGVILMILAIVLLITQDTFDRGTVGIICIAVATMMLIIALDDDVRSVREQIETLSGLLDCTVVVIDGVCRGGG